MVILLAGYNSSFGGRRRPSVFPAASADGDVAEGSAFRPVSPARFAEIPRLREAVVVVVTEFGVG